MTPNPNTSAPPRGSGGGGFWLGGGGGGGDVWVGDIGRGCVSRDGSEGSSFVFS